MRSRLARLAVVAAIVGGAFALQGTQVSGADDQDPIGYTIGVAASQQGRAQPGVQLLPDRPQDRCRHAGERGQWLGALR